MAVKQLPLPGELVKKSNALARARWSAESVWEPRLVALLASKVRTDDTDFHVYEIHVSELLQGAHSGRHYQEIESIIDKVMSRVLTIRDDDGWTKYNVFSRCRFRRSEGILELGFHPDLKPHYLNLQKYMKYNLMEFLLLPSIYSQRIFELLKSWDDKPETPTIPLIDLHEMLNVPESFRANFKDFRIWVLEKAHKDITQRTGLVFEWEAIKQGRAVVAVRFTFGKRALPVAKQKALDAQTKAGERQKMLAAAFSPCLKERGSACEGGHQKQDVCELCRRVR